MEGRDMNVTPMKLAQTIAFLSLAAVLAACNTTGGGQGVGGDNPPSIRTKLITMQNNSWQSTGPYLTVGANCQLVGVGRIRILEQPVNGTVRVVEQVGTPAFASGHRLEHCNTRKHPGPSVFYRPKTGFVGEDSYTYEVVFNDGERRVFKPTLIIDKGNDPVRSPRLFGIRL
jgi:predicted small secreted protein